MTGYEQTPHDNAAQQQHTATMVQVNTPALPKDTGRAINAVMKSISDLAQLYDKETAALNAADTSLFMNIQEEKLVIARTYQNHMAQMLARKEDLQSADASLKNKLREMHNDFTETSQKNMEALERMQRCTERLGNTVRLAALRSSQTNRACSYGETGAVPNTSQRRAVSAGMNETV